MAKKKINRYPENKKFIDSILKATGDSLSVLAKRIGESRQNLQHIYHGRSELRLSHIRVIRPVSGMHKDEYISTLFNVCNL